MADRKARRDLTKEMKAAGYKKLGAGVDAIVFAKTKDEVVKIVMPSHSEDYESAKKSAKEFHNFVKANPSEFLPKFKAFVTDEIEEVELDGQVVLLISMERLKPMSVTEQQLYWFLIESAMLNRTVSKTIDFINDGDRVHKEFGNDADGMSGYRQYFSIWNRKADAWVKPFIETVIQLYNHTKKIGFEWDLHTENIMKRANGTPVIIDPWLLIKQE